MEEQLQAVQQSQSVMPKKILFGILSVALILIIIGAVLVLRARGSAKDELTVDDAGTAQLVTSVKDSDRDGLSDAEESSLGTDMNTNDTDQDGLTDYQEVKETKTDPKNPKSKNPSMGDYDWVQEESKKSAQ